MEEYEASNIKAFVRVRPPLQRELDSKKSVPIVYFLKLFLLKF